MDKFVIAITRTCGSGATSIGKILAKNLGVEIYDRNILRLASDDSGISEELFEAEPFVPGVPEGIYRRPDPAGEGGFHLEQ